MKRQQIPIGFKKCHWPIDKAGVRFPEGQGLAIMVEQRAAEMVLLVDRLPQMALRNGQPGA
jgi:hypothetical protein